MFIHLSLKEITGREPENQCPGPLLFMIQKLTRYPGKKGQKIGMISTLAMNVIRQSGTPTFT